MSNSELIVPADQSTSLHITITTIDIPVQEAGRPASSEEISRALTQLGVANAPVAIPAGHVHSTSGHWSPMAPLRPFYTNYLLTRDALGSGGRMGVVYVCLTAGLASVVWRHYTLPIGIGGGLIVAAIMFVRTGAYREYLAAIKDAQGLPLASAVLRYNLACLSAWITTRWRR